MLSASGHFLFISPDLCTLWGIDSAASAAAGGTGLAQSCAPRDMLRFTDADEVFDDRTVLTVGLFGMRSYDDDEADTSSTGEEDLWVRSIRPGCHTLICGDNDMRVDFQCDWITGLDGQGYLVASGPASPNIPQNEDKMQKLLHQLLDQKDMGAHFGGDTSTAIANEHGFGVDSALRRGDGNRGDGTGDNNDDNGDMDALESAWLDTAQPDRRDNARALRPKTPLSARLRSEEIGQFMDMSDDLMCTAHLDGSLIRFNRSFEEILGFKPEQLIGKSFMDFVLDGDRPLVRNAFYGLGYHDGGDVKDIDFEARMMCAPCTTAYADSAATNTSHSAAGNDDFRWVRWQIRKHGNGFYCLGQDVTNMKLHQRALDRRQLQLVEAQALARMGHWRWEVGSDVIEWSDQLYSVFGVQKEQFITTLDNVNRIIHRRDIGRLFQAFQRAIIQQNDYDMDFRIRRPDGAERFIRCEGRCELDHEGDVIALYGIMQDVTEQMEHEQDLRTAKEAAESAYAAKSRFLANMSHELRTPLNAIIGFSEMIEHQLLGPVGNPKYIDYVSGIRESGQHLLDLISDILDMSKIEAGKYELDLEEVNISKTIRLALHMMEGRALDAGVKLLTGEGLEQDAPDVKITADRRAIMQILLNLLSNAVKFTRQGGQVMASCLMTDKGIRMVVADTGIGIPANKLSAVLKPFEQAAHELTRDHEGSGLGLSITKELAELHGGTIRIESKIEVGTTVSVSLPSRPPVKKRK